MPLVLLPVSRPLLRVTAALALCASVLLAGCATETIGYCGKPLPLKRKGEQRMYALAPKPPRLPPCGPPAIFKASDCALVPMSSWLPAGRPRAVIIASPGLDMACSKFSPLGTALAARHYAVFALDLRGQGYEQCPRLRGTVAPWKKWVADVEDLTAELRKRYPGTPVFYTGQSTGDCVVLSAACRLGAQGPDGILLHSFPLIYLYSPLPVRVATFIGGNMPFLARDPLFSSAAGLQRQSFSFGVPGAFLRQWIDSPLRVYMSAAYLRGCFVAAMDAGRDIPEIHQPVLIQQGCEDSLAALVCRPDHAFVTLQKRFVSSPQVTAKLWENAGHLLLFEPRSRGEVIRMDEDWLDAHIER